ncbi:MAG: hypothetical protein ACPLTR_08495 [Thermacetogeniaceae bacterium]
MIPINALSLEEWLAAHEGPYDVCLLTIDPTRESEYTAGRASLRADRAEVFDGVVAFRQDSPGGEMVFVTSAFDTPEAGVAEDGTEFWRAVYANLQVPVAGFYPFAVVVVTKPKGG